MKVRFIQPLAANGLFLLLALILAAQFVCAEIPADSVSKGTIDLRQKSWGQGRVFSLQESWLFNWNTFVHTISNNQDTWRQVEVPGPWSQQKNDGLGQEPVISPTGFGTYYTKILIPDHIQKAYIYIPDMASAYELWHNGEFLGGNGSIGTSKALEKADYLPTVYELRPIDGAIEVFIKTSNYHYLWGGLWYTPTITDESGVHEIREFPILKAMISATMLLATAIFCWFMYLSRKQDKKILFFSLFCFAIGLRRLCIDERVLYLLDLFDWQVLQSVENVTLYLMLPLFLSYFQFVFPQSVPRRLPALGWLSAIPFCIAAIFLEVRIYSGFNPYFQVVVLLFLPKILLGWGRAFKAKVRHSRMFGLSLLIFVAAVINDMLNYSYIIQTTNLTHMGVLAFVLFQLASLISRYLENFRAIEALSETLKEKNEALIQHDEFKDDFLANTSHELRMPLHGMAGLAKTVRKNSPDLPEDSQNKIKLIEATAVRLGNLVNDILDMSSLKHGKLNIEMHPTYIESLIETTVHSLRPLIKNKPITLDYKVDDDASVVFADEQRLQQIFYNLIGNAIKFTRKGAISIEAYCQGEQVHVFVKDSGIGMSAEQLDTALHAYETHDRHAGNELRGSGLGLSITKMLVELHGGTLDIDSKEGLGTSVSFTLSATEELPKTPVEHKSSFSPEPEPISSTSVMSNNALTQNALVFFADDEEVNRELVSSQLSASGYQVQTFADGQSLLQRLNDELPDLVLLDWVMPEKDGLEVCTTIREQHDACNLPIIMLTAKHQTQNIVQALNAGANDYLTKPYHEQELIARVSSQISVKRLLLTMIENEKLKGEVARQEHQRRQLDLANQRLANTLEASQENILLLNEDLDIIYANAGAKTLLSIATDRTQNVSKNMGLDVELSITTYISDDSVLALKQHMNNDSTDQSCVLDLKHLENGIQATIRTTDMGQDRYLSLVLNDLQTNTDGNTQELLSSLTQEIAQNRQRMEQIESTLLKLNSVEQTAVQASGAGSLLNAPATDNTLNPQELVVKTLRTTLISWERYTHKTKADLAEESHCWRVYLDGATAKTRTLDKYLSVKTLPAKPRWRAVIKTANFVLDHCDLSSADRQELEDLAQQLTEAFC